MESIEEEDENQAAAALKECDNITPSPPKGEIKRQIKGAERMSSNNIVSEQKHKHFLRAMANNNASVEKI